MSVQTMVLGERRLVAGWAADCAERVLPLFEAESRSSVPREAIARTRAFAAGQRDAAGEIRRRFIAGRAANEVQGAAARAAARSAAQAAAVAHVGAHALGAAAYAASARGLDGLEPETGWQLAAMSEPVRAALSRLPLLGSDPAGPLGPGLLASGAVGDAIRLLQAGLGRG